TPAARSRFFRSVVPADLRDADELVRVLLDLASRLRSRPVLVPTGDLAAMVVDERARELRDTYRFPCQPPGLASALYEKRSMYHLCLEHGVPTPATWFPRSRDDVEALLETATYPVVVKP